MDSYMKDKLINLIKKWEGVRLTAYLDTAGIYTIGIGHTGKDIIEGMVITPAQADDYLVHDLAIATADALILYPKLHSYLPARQDALVSLSFQLGRPRLSRFTNFNKAVRMERWIKAAEALFGTLWKKQMDGKYGKGTRDDEVYHMIRMGLYPDEVPGTGNSL
jgi:lysozyme